MKVEEILKAHVSHQQLTPELATRALKNFLEELDPAKTYFIESDIVRWIDPSSEVITKTLEGYKKEDFSIFEEIHQKMIVAIERRNKWEAEMASITLLEWSGTSRI